jgi:hypothetical protein
VDVVKVSRKWWLVLVIASLLLMTAAAILMPMPMRPFMIVAAVCYALAVGPQIFSRRPAGDSDSPAEPTDEDEPPGV